MIEIPDNVRQVLTTKVPAAIINEITCFQFYDNHPRCDLELDVILCTFRGELREYNKRELVCSTAIEECGRPTNVTLYRNTKGDLYYIVAVASKLCIYSRHDSIVLQTKVSNVDSYELVDSSCNGQACLKIIHTDDAVPLYFDEDFRTLENGLPQPNTRDDTSLPVLTQLMTKLTEAKYSVKCNERAYEDLANLRQIAAFSIYQDNIMADCAHSLFLNDVDDVQCPEKLKVKSQKPWVKVCNGKIVIVLEVFNESESSATDIHILLDNEASLSITHTTRIFKSESKSPFWSEQSQTINQNVDVAIVAVIDLKELQYNVTSSVKFSGIVSYRMNEKEHVLPFESVTLTAQDMMGEEFDVLANITSDNSTIKHNLLAVFATTLKTDLCLRRIQEIEDRDMDIIDAFCQYLLMERIPGTSNIVVRRGSPCHLLNGVMIVLKAGEGNMGTWIISVHARSSPQVLALIHYIHDAIPTRIVVTTTNNRLCARTQLYSHHNEDIPIDVNSPNYYSYGASVLKQTASIIKYFDKCMIMMNESKDPVVKSKVGKEIDVFAGGVEEFLSFRNELLEDGSKGVSSVIEHSVED